MACSELIFPQAILQWMILSEMKARTRGVADKALKIDPLRPPSVSSVYVVKGHRRFFKPLKKSYQSKSPLRLIIQ